MEVVTYHLHKAQILGLKYDMDAYVATLVGGEAWDLCWELGRAKN
jgi:hypothetical protein